MDLSDTGWPVPDESRDGWWAGLPYPLYDMRHQGYMGRQFARAEHRRLGVSSNPEEWSDDDVLHVLSSCGSDVSGSLILGNPAFELWQASQPACAAAAAEDTRVWAGVCGAGRAGHRSRRGGLERSRRLPEVLGLARAGGQRHAARPWATACSAAVLFWTRAQDARIGEDFRRTCALNAQRLQQIAQRV